MASRIGAHAEELICAAVLVLARKYADSTAFSLGIRRTTWSPTASARDLVASMPSSLRLADHLAFVAAALRAVRAPEPERDATAEIVCVLDGPAAVGLGAELVVSHERSQEGAIVLHADADEHRFGTPFVQRMLGHLERLLYQMCTEVELTIGQLSVTTDAEVEQLRALTCTRRDYPRDSGVYQLFAEQAAARPDSVAISHQDGPTSYRELQQQAEELARWLRAQGVSAGSRIAFLLEKTPRLLAVVLAIVRLGACYVPIDPSTPAERRAFLLADSGARLLVTEDPRVSADIPVFDLTASRANPADGGPLPAPAGPEAEAYVMYTSGTTGRPKGVVINQRAVVRLVYNTDFADLSPDARILQTGAIAFDATTFEFWGALLNGGTVVLVPATTMLNAVELRAAIEQHRANLMFLTAALFNQLVDQDPTALAGCHVLVGGEALSPAHVARAVEACPSSTFSNAYGPTENTTFSVAQRITETGQGRIPIGRPIANSTAWVLDRDGHPQPLGVPGELHVGGDGLSSGYLNRPELNQAAFVAAPGIGEGRLYRTGDIVRWTEDGLLDYLGRADNQVKIRGYRIELGEIEVQLGLLPGVREAAVVLHPLADGIPALRAFVTAEARIDAAGLGERLAAVLPEYMMPSVIQQVPAMPRTQNNKIDRAALNTIALPSAAAAAGERAPRTELETTVAAAFAEVLGVASVSLDDDFFELGGHSLRMMRLWNRLRSVTGVPIELKQVLDTPTVAGIAALLEQGAAGSVTRPRLVRRS
ncbi:non-ribosomal peptide synthetase [Streptomyces sp. LS1784]|uniref:non-ribosomal peptide synthetase n=1 Tax=Streptomyces sp. LS1784 TaxID=2851533 RepID=UPI001CCB1B3F|nr:non-ribosomal peptide synthetase [Streptomyces sp. LS1784]